MNRESGTEEEYRARGKKVSYRLDELPPGEYRLMTTRKITGCVLDIWKLRQEAAIVIATPTKSGALSIPPSVMCDIYRSERWLIPDRIPVAWGAMEDPIGFVNSTFYDNVRHPDWNIGDHDPHTLGPEYHIRADVNFLRMHRYGERFLRYMYGVEPREYNKKTRREQ